MFRIIYIVDYGNVKDSCYEWYARNNFEKRIGVFSSISSFYLTRIIEFSGYAPCKYVYKPSDFCILRTDLFLLHNTNVVKLFTLRCINFGFAVFLWHAREFLAIVYIHGLTLLPFEYQWYFVDLRVLLLIMVAPPRNWKNTFWRARAIHERLIRNVVDFDSRICLLRPYILVAVCN